MCEKSNTRSLLVGLVGYRCCGKSTVRSILRDLKYPVFDTNSVPTGDPDANTISLDEILIRYGRGFSYINFIEPALRNYLSTTGRLGFVDSLKVASDREVIQRLFPQCQVEIWYVHASFHTRKIRYLERDLLCGLRNQPLEDHDTTLEKHGIISLIKQATEVINTELEIDIVQHLLQIAIARAQIRLDIV